MNESTGLGPVGRRGRLNPCSAEPTRLTEPYPSPTDVAAAPDPSWHYVIISLKREAPEARSYRIIDGQIYALDHDGLLRIKFLYRLPGGALRLRSYNREEYGDEDYSFDEIMEQRIQIIGRVFWWSTLNPLNGPSLL